MKKILLSILALFVILLSSCTLPTNDVEDGYIELPNITGFSKTEIQTVFENLGVEIYFIYSGTPTLENELTFKEYGLYLLPGHSFDVEKLLPIIIYPEFTTEVISYFEIIDFDYDGPYLDTAFSLIDPVNPRGGYFDVTLSSCVDGDTARFNYPQYIYIAIPNFSTSARFLNMDTEETYGTPEEWGKPASVYTCDLLSSATNIKIQTDPGDDLIDNEDYRRLLAWIWVKLPSENDYFLLNYLVVKQGLAQVKYEFGSGETINYGEYTYNEWMHIAEDFAVENNLGQWGNSLDYYWDYDNNTPDYSKWY